MLYIETERLLLRDWQEADLPAFTAMNADPEVMRFFRSCLSDEETRQFYQRIQEEFNQESFGLYAAEIKQTGDFIGFIGFHNAAFEADFTPCVEIGWRLKEAAWGKGLATEGAKACLDYGFNQLGLSEVYSFTAAINQPSRRVMEKIGMEYVKSFVHPVVKNDEQLAQHVLYRITKI
ncbi:ribosomal-protein-alanine N-acetyltransferase [Amphibacillus marinus]|uniref:Ribosomal-protein-alanine N-acetyltransferase n=1 Tax=Amphibacillus marinus TaxID=872970 RepID=A0A1H8M566_9BACI|nr:GNAT family N-acetyltransferase [Amphibacillus marinus]SEO12527.1 ribosomal-protein-alanine N-acetyltransferase [Amphibacillus marinus]